MISLRVPSSEPSSAAVETLRSSGNELVDTQPALALHQRRLDMAIERAKAIAARQRTDSSITDFDVRGELYGLAHEVAPLARQEELDVLNALALPTAGEQTIDVAAGTGFVTEALLQWTERAPYAVDPSREQLGILKQRVPSAVTLLGCPDDPDVFQRQPLPQFDLATSLGGLHHVQDQRRMFANVASVLRPGGRFVFGDVGAGTSVAEHFDVHVSTKCLTGHSANWLSPERLPELLEGTGLALVRASVRLLHMRFQSELQMALFFKGLHAYDLSPEAIAEDLVTTLGVTERDGLICLKWPLLYAYLQKA